MALHNQFNGHTVAANIRRVDESTTGAPTCPMCEAHFMVRSDDGVYACPSGCPERVRPARAPTHALRGFIVTLRGTYFALCDA